MTSKHSERILDHPVEEVFHRLISLATRILESPRALVTFLEGETVRIQAQIGLPDEPGSLTVPASPSVTSAVVAADAPLMLEDLRGEESLAGSASVKVHGTVSCAAVPLRSGDGRPVGAFIVADVCPRQWSESELSILETLAATAMAEIEARQLAQVAETERREKAQVLEAISDAFYLLDADFRLAGLNRVGRDLIRTALALDESAFDGRPVWEVAPIIFGTTVHEALIKARDGRTSASFETFHDGVNRWYAGRVFWVEHQLAIFVKDVTERRTAADALQASEERFRSAFDNAPIGVALTSLDGQLFRVNKVLSDLLGYSPDELLGRNFQDMTHPEDVDASSEALQRLADGNLETVHLEKRYKHADGHDLVVQLDASLVRNTTGQPAYFVIQVLDITKRKETEEELRLMSLVARESLSSVIVTDPQEHIVFVNPAFERFTGYTLDEVRGKRPGDVLRGPLSPEESARHLRLAIRERKPVTVDSVNYRKDGTWYDVEMRIVPVLDASGACTHFIGLANDITERKRAERDLLASEKRFRLLAENAHDIIFSFRVKPRLGFDYVSPSVRNLSGFSPEDLYEDPRIIRRLLFPDDRALFKSLLSGPVSEAVVLRWKRKDGRIIWVELSCRPVHDEQGVLVTIDGIARNVTERMTAIEALRESESRHRALLDAIPDLLFRIRRDGTFLECVSKKGPELTQPFQDLKGIHLSDALPMELADQIAEQMAEVLSTRKMAVFECSIPVDGRNIPSEIRILPAGSEEVLVIARDLGDRKRADVALQRYRLLAGRIHDILLFAKEDGTIVDVNEAAIQSYGYSRDELLHMNVRELRTPAERGGFRRQQRKALSSSAVFETVHCRKDGSEFDVEVSSQGADVDGDRLVVSLVRDISDRKQMEDQLLHQALHDPLTNLPNRALFKDRLEHALARCTRQGGNAAVLFLDLDRFKVVNDSLGHAAGDRLLIAAASRLRSCLRAVDTIARFGGDEFTILLEDVRDVGEATRLANRILRRLQTPFSLEGEEAFVSASIGIAMYHSGSATADDILQQADVAMYQAKNAGRARYVVFQWDMSFEAQERMRLEAELRRAIERDQFRVMYQPIIVMETGRVIGVEALVRWQHPRFGLMPPDDFVPLQEQIGLIEPFTLWVLREAQRQCLEWHNAGYHLSVSVNLSPYNLQDPSFPDHVAKVLAETGMVPSWLKLEITESAVMMNPIQAIESLGRLGQMGVRLSMDDFGTGYSSLSYLKQLPVHEVKIDRSFVAGMDERDEDDTAIVRAIIDLAHNLRKKVVAEGVESRAVWDLLNLLGCDAAQGYYMGRPMLSVDLMAWLDESTWGMSPASATPGYQAYAGLPELPVNGV